MKRKNESGVVVVEAAIVVTVVVMFIAVMLYIGMVFYQQSLVNIMANQTASNIAQIYGNTLRDPFTGYIDADGVNETVTYSDLKNEAYMDVIEQKADAMAMYRLKSSRILTTGTTDVEVEVVAKTNELLKDQVVVTITDEYSIPLISFFGANNNTLTFKATGRADCTDLLEYLSGVPALGNTDGNPVIFFPEEYTVNFYKQYGDSVPYRTMTVLQGYSIGGSDEYSNCVWPDKPINDNMKFVSWHTEDGHLFTADSIVNEDMNVYGKWQCDITFDPDGGKIDGSTSPKTIIAIVGEQLDLPDAERDGCNFAGWYTKKNGAGEYFDGSNIQGNITLYAKWTCTVSFNADGGSVSPQYTEVIYGKSLSQSGISLPIPSRSGCSYAGWFMKRYGEGSEFTANFTITQSMEIFAKWNCVVRFRNSNGNQSFPDKAVVAGKKLSMPTPSRSSNGNEGWQFDGWKDSSGTVYTSNSVINCDLVLYENWHCNHGKYKDDQIIKKAANCKERHECQRTCTYCDIIEEYMGGKGNHCFEGRCGKTHDLGSDSYRMESHGGNDNDDTPSDDSYQKTTKGECNVCLHCSEFWDGITAEVEEAGWTIRNNQIVSKGMYCREHIYRTIENDVPKDSNVTDDAYSDRKKINVPNHYD